MPEYLSRKQELLGFARNELDQLKAGETRKLSTPADLAKQFGYRPQTVRAYLYREGLSKERKMLRQFQSSRMTDRVHRLVDYVEQEASQFQAGTTNKISTYSELADLFGYISPGGVYQILRRHHSLHREERKTLQKQTADSIKERVLTPSQDLAWMIGAVAGGGYVGLESGEVTLYEDISGQERHLLEKFRSVGELFFKINATRRQKKVNKDGSNLVEIRFSNQHLARAFGDLRASIWSTTLVKQHQWILEDNKYLWGFIAGLYDTNSSASTDTMMIRFNTVYPEVAGFITELLTHMGISSPRVSRPRANTEDIVGVIITHIRDLKLFAANVHSLVDSKEERLEFFRQYRPEFTRVRSPEELIGEYERARTICLRERGRLPSDNDLDNLRKAGVINYSGSTFANYFGGGKFAQARNRLEDIVVQRGTPALDSETRHRGKGSPATLQEVMDEWKKLVEILQHSPSDREIKMLRKQGRTRFYPIVYINRCGEGSFSRAKFVLDVNLALERYEEISGRQVRFVPKQHFCYDYDARERLNKLLSQEVQDVDNKKTALLIAKHPY